MTNTTTPRVLRTSLAFLVAGVVGTAALAADLTVPVAGRISIELIGSDAAYSNTLAIASPNVGIAISGCKLEPATGLTGTKILSEKLSQRGCRVDLDADPTTGGIQPFAANTTFSFNFCAITTGGTACDYVWSSNPGNNSDGEEHLHTTPVQPGQFPGQIYQLNWEDQENLGDEDFNDLIAVLRVNIDSDEDGLWDDWETVGIDSNGDGVIDLNLPALGADPMHKDVFLEIDWMDCSVAGSDCPSGDTHSHEPVQAAIDAVVDAFANAPDIVNPDGQPGVNIHVDLSNAIAHRNTLIIPGACFSGSPAVNFDTIKSDPANFGDTSPRRFAYHYQLWTHGQQSSCSWSGCAELPGNDSQISLGGWNYICSGGGNAGEGCCTDFDCQPGGTCQPGGDLDGDGTDDTDVGTVQQQAGTMIHELGHNLNLHHGGGNWLNRKPNYLSVMNYSFQLGGIPPSDPDGSGPLSGRVDYSGSSLPTLAENNLDEGDGISDGTDTTVYYCPDGTSASGAGSGAIDWDCDGTNNETGVSTDLNDDANVDCVREGSDGTLESTASGDDVVVGTRIREGANRQCDTTAAASDVQWRPVGALDGFDDWAGIKYDFQNTEDYEDGVHQEIQVFQEVDYQTFSVELAADPLVVKKASPDPVVTGSIVSYRISLRNESATAAREVVLTDLLPSTTRFVSCFATGGGTCGGTGNDRSVTYTSLPGGASEMITIEAEVLCPVVDGTAVANSIALSSVTVDTDNANNASSAIVMASNPPPAITEVAVDRDTLWPPEHEMIPVRVDYTVTDNCGTVVCALQVTSDEPEDGLGDGDTAPDWMVIDEHNVMLRAERDGRGDGRIYTIRVTCTDESGASSTETVPVTVPHDRKVAREADPSGPGIDPRQSIAGSSGDALAFVGDGTPESTVLDRLS